MVNRRSPEEGKALKVAYQRAGSRLRDENRAEFERLYVEEAAKLGVQYTPQPTGLDLAREQLRALLDKYPDLKSEVAA